MNFLDRCQRGPIRLVLRAVFLVIIGWLGGNAVFSETALRIFLTFCMKLEDYAKRPPNQPKIRHFFGLKLVLHMTFNLNETYWQCLTSKWRYLTSKSPKIVQIEVFGHFLDFASLVFLDFAHNVRRACLVVFLQFASPVNVSLFLQVFRNVPKILKSTRFLLTTSGKSLKKKFAFVVSA